ncbi:type I pullulanase [Prevotella sp. OH937_COT-195]|uniref:type I pullulanase n=1 Tax=Prevotella sp. OH937_COT-195 TaxID=2491051 RepID=UPI000F64CC36|nr:type I pullulanase [Prevotella sp. OH937_COT-195]RRD02495.1 type I pullulanase [Prevotella sp. OH937_COT-195]
MKRFLFAGILYMLISINVTAQNFSFNEADYTPSRTTFRLFAPKNAKKVKVDYGMAVGKNGMNKPESIKMKLGKDGIWTATVKKNLAGYHYRFVVDGRQSPGVFAKAVGVNGREAVIIDMKTTDPEGWEKDHRPVIKSPADLVIYEMHHRDFSISPSSGIKNKGKFLALTEPKGIDHLKSLGVNAVHILPSYDYGSVDETRLSLPQYNWGYDPVNYNVPDGSYSTDPYTPEVRIREFKQMVQALHKAGIRVILDVVYNHTYDIENSNFQNTYPDYYYRKNADGSYSNGSGCGNETASEKPMMRQFMLESVKYWINEYHIDGFRFDLMGVHDIATMNEIRRAVDEIDPTIFIYGEGWSAGACAFPAEQLATKAHISRMPRIAAFSDELRDGLRGPFSDDSKGAFLAGVEGNEESIKFGIAGCISHPQVDMSRVNYSKEAWAAEPVQTISYVSCHDDMCLIDRLLATTSANFPPRDTQQPLSIEHDSPLIALSCLAQTAVLTSQGVPFIFCGEEMMRDKKGVHNSYKSPDSVNALDWDNLKRHPEVFTYYKKLIQLRKNHPAFRLGSADLVRRHLQFLPTRPCLVAYRLVDNAGGDTWKNIYVVLNGNWYPRKVDIPEGKYTVVCAEGVINEDGIRNISGNSVTVAPQSALIFHD